MARCSLKNVEKESLERPALVFTDSDSEHCQERRWKEPRQKVQNRRVHAQRRVPISGGHFAEVFADPLASRSLDEDDGARHSSRYSTVARASL